MAFAPLGFPPAFGPAFGADPFAHFPPAETFGPSFGFGSAPFGLAPFPAAFPHFGSFPATAPAANSSATTAFPSTGFDGATFGGFPGFPAPSESAAPAPASAAAEAAPQAFALAPEATSDSLVREALDDVVLFIDTNHVSPLARSVLYFALAAGVPIKCCPVDLSRGEHKEEAYLQINPDGKVPALRDSLLYLFESGAIIRYLARKTNSDMEGGADAAKYGKVQCAIEFVRNNVVQPTRTLVSQLYIAKQRGEEANEVTVADAKNDLHNALTFLERFFFKQQPEYVIGTSLTSADIYLACALKTLDLCGDVFDYCHYPIIHNAMQKQADTDEFAGAHKKFNEHLESLNLPRGHVHIAEQGAAGAEGEQSAPPEPVNEGTD